jgi:hypothetical protein
MNLGLCGGHRTGKTTLAQAIADRRNMPFVKTDTSAVFKKFNLDPSAAMNFDTRLTIQHQILAAAIAIWEQESRLFISDRTPIDMMAYTIGDIQGKTDVNFDELADYLNLCFDATNKFFKHLAIVQPGIPLVYEVGKAALNLAYIEHINILVMGLCSDRRLKSRVVCLDRSTLSLEERIKTLLELC